MSIYPVRIRKWYRLREVFGKYRQTLKWILPFLRCERCKGAVSWAKGYVMHSVTFGGPSNAWCCYKCLEGGE